MEKQIITQHNLSENLAKAVTLDEALTLCLETAIRVSEMDCGGIYLVDRATGDLVLAYTQGLPEEFIARGTRFRPDSPLHKLVMTGKTLYTGYRRMDEAIIELAPPEYLRGIAVVPVVQQDQIIACINVASRVLNEAPPASRKILEDVAHQIGESLARFQADGPTTTERGNHHRRPALGSMYLVDRQCRYQFVNNFHLSRLGVPLQEILDRPYDAFHPKEDADEFAGHVARVFETGEEFQVEYRSRRDGRFFLRTFSPIRDVHGQIVLVTVVSIDVTGLKQTEMAREENERKYRELADSLPQIVFEADPQGRLTFVNRASYVMSGYSPADVEQGMNVLQLVIPKEREQAKANIIKLATGELLGANNYTFLRKDGRTFPILSQTLPVVREGKVEGLRGFVVDISDVKRSEERLHQSEEKFSKAFHASPAIMAIVSLKNARLIEVNRAFERLTGYRRDEVIGRTIAKLGLLTGQGDLKKIIQSLTATNSFYSAEFKFRNKEGKEITGLLSVEVTDFDGEPCALSVFEDITERKRAEVVSSRLAHLVEMSSDAIINAGLPELIISDWNRGAEQMFGYPAPEIVGRPISLLVPKDQLASHEKIMREFIDGRKTPISNLQATRLTQSGQAIYVSMSVSPVFDDAGRLVSISSFLRDITKQKKAEDRLHREMNRTKLLLELYLKAPQLTDRELYDYVLDQAIHLTESTIGFIHRIGNDGKTIILTTWNAEALKSCTATYDTHYPLDRAGNWVDCVHYRQPVVYNDFPNSPNQKGLPKGHTPIRCFMSIPVIDHDVRLIFGVGNKTTEYDDHDVDQLQLVANELYKIMMKRQDDEKLRRLNRFYSVLYAINETIIHTWDRQKLFDKICDIAVEKGMFRMALIGLNDPLNGRLSLQACRGGDRNFPACIDIRPGELWEKKQDSQGHEDPFRGFIVNDIEHDARYFDYLRGPSLEQGFRSMALFPLCADQQPIGTIILYSAEKDYFQDDEINLLQEMANNISFALQMLRQGEELTQSFSRLRRAMEQTTGALAAALEKRDPYTAGHQQQVAVLASAIAQEMALDQKTIEGIRVAAMLHDIGKIYIPSEILTKPGKLSGVEFNLIKEHPQAGHDIIKDVEFPWPVALTLLQHHEKIDGSGYPAGLRGEEIILEARIICVADVVEAMASHRPYRPAMGIEKALDEISRQKGILYDTQVVNACLRLFREKNHQLIDRGVQEKGMDQF